MSDLTPIDAPPTEADEFPAEQPQWPKVVGIISIVWGSVSLLCGGCGLASPWMMNLMPPEQRAQLPDHMISGAQMVAMVVGMGFSVLLIVAGIMTIARKQMGRYLHLVQALCSFVIFAVSIYLNIQQQEYLKQWAAQNPDTNFAKQLHAGGNMGNIIGYVFGALVGLAYPVFCLIWFGIVKRKPGSMGAAAPADDELI